MTVDQIREQYNREQKNFHAMGQFILASCATQQAKNGSHYATITLQDATGTLQVKKWDVDPEKVNEQKLGGKLFDIRLEVQNYQGQMSAVVTGIRGPKEASLEELLVFSGFDTAQNALHLERIEKALGLCDTSEYGPVLRALFSDVDVWQQFAYAPGSVHHHHAYTGGLVAHVVEILDLGEYLLHETADRAYFLAGAIVHDIGKLDTYVTPPKLGYSLQGQMATHESWSMMRLALACKEAGASDLVKTRLMHMVEQAHGDGRAAKWIVPVGQEVKALALADNFSAKSFVDEREVSIQAAIENFEH